MERSEVGSGSGKTLGRFSWRRDGAGVSAPEGWLPPANLPGWTAKDTARFWSKVDRSGGEDACWPWLACVNRNNGYGRFMFGGKKTTSHRVAVGAFTADLVCDHLCRNRGCVNPKHVEEVTSRENTLRGLHGRLITECRNGHIYDDRNTGYSRGRRRCRKCNAIRCAKSRMSAPAAAQEQ